MKTKNFIVLLNLLVAVFLVTFLSGCDKDLVDINNSPNAISEVNVKTAIGQQATLVGLQSTVGDWYSSDRSRFLSIWTRQMCAPSGLGRPQPVTWNTYLMERSKNSPNDYIWSYGYRIVKLSNDIIDNAPASGLISGTVNLYMGMAKFYKALALGELAALYGSIPINIKVDKPTFVKQSDAYAHVQVLLNEAIVHFQAGTVSDARDLNFQGNQARWIAASNSLKARYFMHMLQYSSAVTAANAGITAPAGNVNSIYSTTTTEYSPWGHWVNTETGEPIRANKYYIDLLRSEAGDTRLATFFRVRGGAASIVGHDIYADLGGTGDELTPTRAAGILRYSAYNDPFPLISYQENVLIRAEAAARATGTVDVTDLNIIRTGAGLPARANADFANTTALITEILKQKYIQLLLEGQNYHDMRRTNRTDGRPYYRTGIPPRFLYPESEITTNPNVPADNAATVNELW